MYQTSDEYKQRIYSADTKHILNIYIENNLVNPNHILDFKTSHYIFSNDEFTLGSVTAKTIEFKIYKTSLPEVYKNIYVETGIEEEVIPLGHFILEELSKNDDNTVTLKAIDYMSKFEFNYDGSNLEYPCSLNEVLSDICLKANVEKGIDNFLNMESQIAVYDNTVSAREYLSYIAEQAGGFAIIGRDGKLYIKNIGESVANIKLEYFQNFTWGEQFKISKVAYEDGIRNYKLGSDENNTLWINSNNMYVVDESQFENIYNLINGFDCYSFEGTTIIDPALDIGDIIVIDDKKVIYQSDLEYMGKFKASIKSKIGVKEKEETTKTVVSNSTKIRRVQSEINQVEGVINQVIQEQTEQGEKLSKTIQDIDSLTTSFEIKGGINLIDNAMGQSGLEDYYQVEGYKTITEERPELKNNTVSSYILGGINNVITRDKIISLEINKQYTITFKYHNDLGNLFKFEIATGNDDYITLLETTEEVQLKELVYTFIAQGDTKFRVSNSYLDNTKIGYYTDLILIEGNTKQSYEPAPNEVIGGGVKINYKGVTVYSNLGGTINTINNAGHEIVDINNSNNVIQKSNINGNLFKDTTIKGYLKIENCRLEEQVVNEDNLLFIG